LIALAALAGIWYITHRWPWIWHGSKDAYQRHRIVSFTLPPDQIVYEEDMDRAARLLRRPPKPSVASLNNGELFLNRPNEYVSGNSFVEYAPEFYLELHGTTSANTLVFMHEAMGPTGRRRLVRAIRGSVYPTPYSRRSGVYLRAGSIPIDQIPSGPRLGTSKPSIYIPLAPQEIMRIYAGQPDPHDLAHFTIKYEIDNVPGVIDGRLEADDTVTLKILSGPAATRPTTAPSTQP
jgi:hypothetical protein